MTKEVLTKLLFAFTFVQCAIVLALVVSYPSHRFDKDDPGSTAQLAPERDRAIQLICPDIGFDSKEQAKGLFVARSGIAGRSPANGELHPRVIRSDLVGKKPATNVPQAAEGFQANLPEPTLEQVQQTLDLPLAFFDPPAEAGLTAAQTADAAGVAAQFVNAVGGANQDPADPAYAARYDDARVLADAQVWAVSGQTAYMALIDARAQAAGNPPDEP